MKKELEQAFTEQARRLFSVCETYIDGTYSLDEKGSLLEQIAKTYNGLEVDFGKMFEEVTANLEEPMSERQRERYCFSLLTPFEAYSNTLYPRVLIGKSQESLNKLQGLDGADKLASIFENQIKNANERANKYFGLGFGADALETDDEAKIIFFELAQIIKGYANMIDAAFVMHGLDLKQLQERCGVWIKRYHGDEAERNMRAMQIKGYIGSLTLAEEYISRLEPQKEPQDATGIELQTSTRQEHQQAEQGQSNNQELPQEILTINNTEKERLIFGRALEKRYMTLENGKYKWHKSYSLLAYMCGKLYCGDRVVEADDETTLNKGDRQMPKTAVERLFGVNVAGNRYALKNPPKDYWIIDELFKSKGASR